jgi:type I restriction enzyme, S subunit
MKSFVALPESWLETNLGELSTLIQYGLNAKSTNDSKGVFYLRVTDIGNDGSVNLSDAKYISLNTPDLADYLLEPGDIVIARSGNTAGISYVYMGSEKPWAFASYLIRFRINQDIADPEYVGYYLLSPQFWRYLDSTKRVAAQPNVNSKELARLPIPLPPLSEQRRIVSILREVDELRRLRRKADERTAQLNLSIFYELFGNPVANPKGWPK